ncbi:MAG TPA: hypothetical protein PKM48_09395 [Parvularculaceae bacterium]|nr:hypothetical protein [Parvularculaceae bacterium]
MRVFAAIAAAFFVLNAEAFAAQFTASKVVFRDVTGEVRITTTSGDLVDVTIRQGKTYSPVSVKLIDGEVVIAGERWRDDDGRNCCDMRINRTENLKRDRVEAVKKEPENRDAFFEDYPVIEVTMPRRNDVTFADARIKLAMEALDGRLILEGCYVYGETSDLGQATIGVISGSRLAIGDVKSMLELDISGMAAVTGGDAAMADIDIAGPGEAMIGAVDGMLDISIAGSGLARAARIDGPMTVRIAGSGAAAVQGGEADRLTATIDGSGGVFFEGRAVAPVLRLYGSPTVRLGSVDGRITRYGAGEVFVADKLVSGR